MSRNTTTVTQTKQKDGESVETDMEMVVCDDCGSVIGDMDDVMQNIIAYNPELEVETFRVDVVERTREILEEDDLISSTEVSDGGHKTATTYDVREEDFVDAARQAIKEVSVSNESVIVNVDYFDEVCDECGLEHGIDLDSEPTERNFTLYQSVSDWVPPIALGKISDDEEELTKSAKEKANEEATTIAWALGGLMVVFTNAPLLYIFGVCMMAHFVMDYVYKMKFEEKEGEV